MAALEASICFYAEFVIMVCRDLISRKSQIVILIHQADINTCRAGLTVIAVDAGSRNGICRKGANDRIVLFFICCSEEF